MLNKLLKKILSEDKTEDNSNVEDQVIGQLDRSAKLDEVDTVTFGLETDDGKIVKVYVKAEQADEFEKALSQKLGEVDDIEETLNQLANDFEIVDVEWPDEKSEDEGEEPVEGQPETDGSEVLNQAVYKKKEGDSMKPKMENLELGDRVALKLLEDGSSLESRMTSPTQMMIYHAILELGIPEIALNKSPYKSSIYLSIKEKAVELAKNPNAKIQLKYFLQKMHDIGHHHKKDDDKEEKNDKHGNHEKEDKHEKKTVKESVEEMLAEALVQDFWECLTKVINHVSDADLHAEKLMKSTKFKTLVSRSMPMIPKTVKNDLRMKLARLSDTLDTAQAKTMGVMESTTAMELTEFFQNIFTMVDPTPGKTVSKALLNSTEFKSFMASARPKLSQKFSGLVQQKYRDVLRAVKTADVTTVADKKPGMTNGPTPTKPVAESVVAPKKVLVETIHWSFGMDDDVASISCEGLQFKLDSEQLEKTVKAISAHETVVVKDAEDPKRKFTFSPRGVNLVIKKIGENTSFQMNATSIDEFMKLVTEEPKDKKEEE